MPTTELAISQQEQDVRPLGYVALGFGVLSLILAPTYFLSLLAYLTSVPALVVGVIASKDVRTRRTGTVGVTLALVAVLLASIVLVGA